MELLAQLEHYAFQYYGVDWAITFTVLLGIFLLGDKKREGFIAGMISAVFGIIFSFQIGSIANGITSLVVLGLYLRGYINWRKRPN